MHTQPRQPDPRRAFTLIEMIAVLLIIALVMAMAAPALRGWSRGAKLRDAGDHFLAATRWARSAAITTPGIFRLQAAVDGSSYELLVLDGQTWSPVSGEFGRPMRLPDGYLLTVQTTGGRSANAIDFHPNGRSTPAIVRIDDPFGGSVELQSPSHAEPFRRTQDIAYR
jgi:prepilin-type N-terminal cleavage/methylation domain-containing protein